MKKVALGFILIFILGATLGCSSSSGSSAEKTSATPISDTSSAGSAAVKQTSDSSSTSSPNKEATPAAKENTSSSIPLTKDSTKKLTDDQLLKMTEESGSTLDDLSIQDEDLNQLDSIINSEDPTSTIPSSVDLKK